MPKDIGFLFDLDGVLIDSERRYTRIWADIERAHPTGIPDFPRVIKGMTLFNILDTYFPDPEVTKDVRARLLRAEADMSFGYMPGAEKLLGELKALGLPVAMVTSSDNCKMDTLRRQLPDIYDYFTAVVDGNMVDQGKPHPAPYLKGAELLGVKPERCAVVEDALNGIRSGRAAGAYVVGMTDTLGHDAVAPLADEVHDSLAEINLPALIEILQNR